MRCPDCRIPLPPRAESCPQCGFSLDADRLTKRFGVPPALQPGINDLARVFSRGQISRIDRRILDFEHGLRQILLSVVTQRIPLESRLGAYAFWIFNASSPNQPPGEAVEHNRIHRILFLVDTSNHRATLTLSYGLEPFVGPETLDAVLQSGATALASGRFAAFLGGCIAALEDALHALGHNLPAVYGFHPALTPGT
ncbi:MAG TPA: hypothetical protein VMN36_01660 [Verrucomicrobiales bacterium]|nr:hypothetical protein [Verrucomicrobiales bacterium]